MVEGCRDTPWTHLEGSAPIARTCSENHALSTVRRSTDWKRWSESISVYGYMHVYISIYINIHIYI